MTSAPPQPPEDLQLAGIFPPAAREEWYRLTAAALRKSGVLPAEAADDAVEQALARPTYDGFAVRPLYTADTVQVPATGLPGRAPFVRGTQSVTRVQNGWDVRAQHAGPDPAATREAALLDLENGVTSLWLQFGGQALPVGSLAQVLDGVLIDLAPLALDAGEHTAQVADELLAVIAERGVDPAAVRGTLGADPIGLRARGGAQAVGGQPGDLAQLAAQVGAWRRQLPAIRPITVDATVFHDAGASDGEELALSISAGVTYLRALTGAGLSVAEAFECLTFRYAATADQFATIAKLRAARRLWARVGEVCAVPEAARAQEQHAVTSAVMMSRRDPWVNMLRTTVACFAAGVGGADAVTVQPFDAAIGAPDDFARRIARNTSALLMLESHVARVLDPAGGSWYVEQLTDDLARAAWDWFTELDAAGGLLAGLDAGTVQQRLADTWQRRRADFAHRRAPLTGVSEFPDVHEKPVQRPTAPVVRTVAPDGLPVHRYADDYEQLRDAADATAAAGARPAVFLATLGPVSASSARAGFAANLFQAGGFATPDSGPGTDPEQIAQAFAASGARVACLASTDRLYGEHAASVASALKKAGAQQIWLAGKPGERAASDAEAGVDGYLHVGCDAVAVLRSAHQAHTAHPA